MDLTKQFQMTDGSVVGRNHVGRGNVLTGLNSQDAFCWYQDPRCIVAVVCDGCGSAPFSEFGARLIANLAAREFIFLGQNDQCNEVGLMVAYESIMGHLDHIKILIVPELNKHRQFVRDHFLATLVACVVTPLTTTIVAIGDGCFVVNGEFCSLDIFESRPPYLAYGLLPRSDGMRRESFHFSIVAQLPTEQVQSLMIGTDGVEDLQQAAHKFLPGKQEQLGPLSQFWTDDIYFQNPVAIDRRLHRANSEHKHYNPGRGRVETFQGLLPDDTTMMVLRRKDP